MSEHEQQSDGASKSAALAYSGEGAPVLVAKGESEIARAIIEVARAHDVPIVQNDQLTELLCQVALGEEIPRNLYVSVAEVLAFVYRLNARIDDLA